MVLHLDVKLKSSFIILSPLSSLPAVICHLSVLLQAPEQDEVLQSIDRAIEGIHNVAMKNGGKYNLEQRDVLQWVHTSVLSCVQLNNDTLATLVRLFYMWLWQDTEGHYM